MYDIIGKRYYYFAISLLIIIPGIIAMIYSTVTFGTPVRLGIDFTGGSSWELRFEKPVDLTEVRAIFASNGQTDAAVQNTGDNQTILVRSKPVTQDIRVAVEGDLAKKYGKVDELKFDSVGPAIGREVTSSASTAVIASSVLILLFIYYAFRRVPNAFRFGVCAIVAMLHDVFVSFGVFSILGLLFGWEADSLFLTALLTVIGFSVQDTIVVFDRIRENVPKHRGESFETVVNRSVLETLHRSVVIQLTIMFVLFTMVLFGGGTTKHFVTVLLYSLFSGMYSSIFNAPPLLVVWENHEFGKFLRRAFGGGAARASA
jgi:preprotein translocase subunit SecF